MAIAMTRRRVRTLLLTTLATLAVPSVAVAQSVVVSGDPGALVVRTATAGLEPDAVQEAATTYAVTTTTPNQKLMARLDAPLPAEVTVTIRLAAPAGATSRGHVTLTTLDQEVVGPIPTPGTYAGLAIVYTHTASVRAGPIAPTGRMVTITVVAGP